MSPAKTHSPRTLHGTFKYLIFSPEGAIEGLLIAVEGVPTQLVIDPDLSGSPLLGALAEGQQLNVSVSPAKPSHKGEPVHAVFRLDRLIRIDGKRISAAASAPPTFSGIVTRFNFAKHGEPNGVVLDSGDFVHMKPEGLKAAKLKIGDPVRVQGESRRLSVGHGHVIEASKLRRGKPKHVPAHSR